MSSPSSQSEPIDTTLKVSRGPVSCAGECSCAMTVEAVENAGESGETECLPRPGRGGAMPSPKCSGIQRSGTLYMGACVPSCICGTVHNVIACCLLAVSRARELRGVPTGCLPSDLSLCVFGSSSPCRAPQKPGTLGPTKSSHIKIVPWAIGSTVGNSTALAHNKKYILDCSTIREEICMHLRQIPVRDTCRKYFVIS